MKETCGYEFEIWNEETSIVFTCGNRVGCDGNPHRAIVVSGDSTATVRFVYASETRTAYDRQRDIRQGRNAS